MLALGSPLAVADRWKVEFDSGGTYDSTQLFDHPGDMPRVDPRVLVTLDDDPRRARPAPKRVARISLGL